MAVATRQIILCCLGCIGQRHLHQLGPVAAQRLDVVTVWDLDPLGQWAIFPPDWGLAPGRGFLRRPRPPWWRLISRCWAPRRFRRAPGVLLFAMAASSTVIQRECGDLDNQVSLQQVSPSPPTPPPRDMSRNSCSAPCVHAHRQLGRATRAAGGVAGTVSKAIVPRMAGPAFLTAGRVWDATTTNCPCRRSLEAPSANGLYPARTPTRPGRCFWVALGGQG